MSQQCDIDFQGLERIRAWLALERGFAERKSPVAHDLLPYPIALARKLGVILMITEALLLVRFHYNIISALSSHAHRLSYHPGYILCHTMTSDFVFQNKTFIDEREMPRTVKGEFRVDLTLRERMALPLTRLHVATLCPSSSGPELLRNSWDFELFSGWDILQHPWM